MKRPRRRIHGKTLELVHDKQRKRLIRPRPHARITKALREIYDERSGLYEKFADHIIDVDEQSIEATAQELAKIARNG